MSKRARLGALIAGTWLMSASTAHAASMALLPPSGSATVGDTIALTVHMDFSDDPTLGGGFDLLFDDALVDFVGFSFDGAFPTDPDFTRDDDDATQLSGEIRGMAFGSFDGIGGPADVGTALFEATGAGAAGFSLRETVDPLVGGFQSAETFTAQDPLFSGSTYTIVPEPGPLALWALGLAGLAAVARPRGSSREAPRVAPSATSPSPTSASVVGSGTISAFW